MPFIEIFGPKSSNIFKRENPPPLRLCSISTSPVGRRSAAAMHTERTAEGIYFLKNESFQNVSFSVLSQYQPIAANAAIAK